MPSPHDAPIGFISDRPSPVCPTVLILGYGNTLRQDDGAGYLIAEKMADLIPPTWPTVRVCPVQQLTPDLAADLATVDIVIFVDAAVPGAIAALPMLEPLQGSSPSTALGHHLDMAALLAIAEHLYNATPTAYRLLIPTQQMAIGDDLSDLTQRAITLAMSQLVEFVTALQSSIELDPELPRKDPTIP
jgi:hydrogenase maturation protease